GWASACGASSPPVRAAAACRASRTRTAGASSRSPQVSFQDDVVDQTGRADARGGGEDFHVTEFERFDVIGDKTVERGTRGGDRIGAVRVRLATRGERPRKREGVLALLGREVRVSRRQRETVRVAHRREDPEL